MHSLFFMSQLHQLLNDSGKDSSRIIDQALFVERGIKIEMPMSKQWIVLLAIIR